MRRFLRNLLTLSLGAAFPVAVLAPACGGESIRPADEAQAGTQSSGARAGRGGSGGSAGRQASAGKGGTGGAGNGGAPQSGRGGTTGSGGDDGPQPQAGEGGRRNNGGESGRGEGGVAGNRDDLECSAGNSSTEIECEQWTSEFCATRGVLPCPSTLETLSRPLPICDQDVVRSSYAECENNLIVFEWSTADPEDANDNQYLLQFSATTGKLQYGEWIADIGNPGHDRRWAGTFKTGSGCRECRICTSPTPGEGGRGGDTNTPGGPSESCVFDSTGRISLPPREE